MATVGVKGLNRTSLKQRCCDDEFFGEMFQIGERQSDTIDNQQLTVGQSSLFNLNTDSTA